MFEKFGKTEKKINPIELYTLFEKFFKQIRIQIVYLHGKYGIIFFINHYLRIFIVKFDQNFFEKIEKIFPKIDSVALRINFFFKRFFAKNQSCFNEYFGIQNVAYRLNQANMKMKVNTRNF